MDPGWQEPDEDAALRRTMQRHVEDLADIFQQVQRSARGKPTADVRAELERGLRERDIPFPPDALDDAARSMAEPNWPLRHPIEFVRWVRDGKRKTARGPNRSVVRAPRETHPTDLRAASGHRPTEQTRDALTPPRPAQEQLGLNW